MTEASTPPHGRSVTLRPVSATRWRVLDRAGRVIGHLRSVHVPEGIRYHAERFDMRAARLRDLGGFWRSEDAVDCLRYSQ